MKKSFLATDVGLSIPVIIFPIGHVGGMSIDILSGLHGLSFNCSLNSEKYPDLKRICQSKNVPLPNEIRSTIFILNDESDFSKIRLRFLLEPSLSFLKWFVTVIFIDNVLNNDIKSLQEYAKTLSISLDSNCTNFFIFSYNNTSNSNNNTNSSEKFKTDEHLFFFSINTNDNKNSDKKESSPISLVIDKLIDFLCPLVIQSIQTQISAIVAPENVLRKKLRSNKAVSAIPRITLTFLSTNLPEKVKIFTETIKIFEDEKNVDNQKYGEILQLLGILEAEHPGTVKKYQLLDHVSNYSHWEIDEKNDTLLIFSIAGSYFMKNLPSRALDCCFRILSFYTNGTAISAAAAAAMSANSNNSFLSMSSSDNINTSISCSTNTVNVSTNNLKSKSNFINNKTIIFMINECLLILEKLNDEDMMQSRGIELITLISRLGQIRKIPMICYQISKILRFRAKADFLLMGIKFLYEQNNNQNNELIIQNLAEPMAETLLKSVVFPLEKCSIIFKILSTIGNFLPKEKQDFLFMKMIDLSIGDVRIPCNIGLKVSYSKIITPAIEIVKVNKADKTKSSSIFLYNGLKSQSNYSHSEGNFSSSSYTNSEPVIIGVGSQFRIEFDLFNPFSLDLPIFISCAKINHCSSEDYPFPLKSKTNNKLVCCLTPVDESEIIIDSVDCVIYSGVQRIVFPFPLKVNSINGVASFSVRTILPIKQTLELYDGEIYHVRMWVTNTGSHAINNLVLRFDPTYLKMRNKKDPIYNEDEIPKLIPPCENVLINLKFNIISNMESILFDVVAQTSLNKGYEAVCRIEQPVKVKVGLNIDSVSLLKNLPEPRFDLNKFVFVGVNIQNHTNDTFNYTASFNAPRNSNENENKNTNKNENENKKEKQNKSENNNKSENENKSESNNEKENENENKNNSEKENNDEKADNNENENNDEKADNNENENNDENYKLEDDDAKNNNNNDKLDCDTKKSSNDDNYGEFLSILSENPHKGLLIGYETTTLIIPIPKSVIENPPVRADRNLKIAAARLEESKIGKRLTNRQRMMVDLRVDMAEFIKYSLNFRWQRGSVRSGNLAMNAIPSEELLEEFQIKRPRTFYSFRYIENGKNDKKDEELKIVFIKKKVELNVRFDLAQVKKCRINLGVFSDSEYGIMWNGSLVAEKDENDMNNNCFSFVFYFAKPGNFTFKAEYETFESIKGFYPLNANVIDT